ncbi:MAG: hypothetical protein BMS9Abin28_2012 [Anaerolineae bacterium]|nr:MAG: hypothetical protein BMS9Abin28_2012 [Anaerolineae bacterium]
MQIRCYRCGWSFAIKQEEAAFALEALEKTGGTHYDSSCPRCRHSNRISLEQLRKAAPRSAEEPGSTGRQIAEEAATGEGAKPDAADEHPKDGSGEGEGAEPEAADEHVEDGSGETEPEE